MMAVDCIAWIARTATFLTAAMMLTSAIVAVLTGQLFFALIHLIGGAVWLHLWDGLTGGDWSEALIERARRNAPTCTLWRAIDDAGWPRCFVFRPMLSRWWPFGLVDWIVLEDELHV